MSTLDAFSRLVTHHQVTIDTKFRTQSIDDEQRSQCVCPVPTMLELSPWIIEQKGLIHSYQSGEIILTLQDAVLFTNRPDKQATHLVLLVNVVNKNGSVTVIKNTQTLNRVEISPNHQAGEGYEVSSHIVISLYGKNRMYDMAYMPIPKVSTSRMNGFLDRVLFEISRKHADKFTAKATTNAVSRTSNKPKTVLYKPVFDMSGKLDQDLFNKINKEGLADVVLVKSEFSIINAPDVNQSIIPKQSTLQIAPNHGSQDVISWVKNISSYFRKNDNGGFNLIRIKFKEPDTDAVRQVELQTSNIKLDGLEKTFIKKSILTGFASRLKDSYDTIENESVSKMIDVM
ncbi:hypothetical protein [Rouxiella badensis]|uniref:hypothetical protein n=1 Tax=Rouxiella badensis TaxID=1646377 RepID=UPI003C4D3785